MEEKIRLKELSKEAVKLIKEFRELDSILGDNIFSSVKGNRSGSRITIEHIYEGKLEFDLSEISSVFEDEMEGFGPCGSGFYEAVELAVDGLDDDFKNMDKKEFIKHAGMICYIKPRCEAIYERLKEIEEEI